MRYLPLLLLTLATPLAAQDAIDARLLADIERIRAIDNHTHIDAVDPARPGRWNAQKPLGTPRYPDVVGLRRDNPDWQRAWAALYGHSVAAPAPDTLAKLLGEKRQALSRAGEAWPATVLDRAGVDIALVNTVKPGPGQQGPRFRWVPYADPLLRPYAGDKSWLLYAGGDASITGYLKDLGLTAPPPTLAEYITRVVDATLAGWRNQGAVAVKFLSAYARGLDFESVPEAKAATLYLSAVKGELAPAQQKALEDYLFNAIAQAAGAHGLVVHIHTGNGDGPYFNNRRANPALLEDALNSRPLRSTKVVLLHGGWPYHEVTQAMLDKPNTYADISAQTFYLGTHQLAQVLRNWLSWQPEKVLFGSDAYSDVDSPLHDWEEKQWLMTWKARRALAIALTAMVANGEISRERALEIARGVLRENAAQLYGLGGG